MLGAVVIVRGSAALAGLLLAFGLAACEGSTPDPTPQEVVSSLGAVPIPSGETTEPTPTAEPGHPALLAIGGTVRAKLTDGTVVLVTALGPELVVPSSASPAAKKSPVHGTITLRASVLSGATSTIAGSDFSSRDDSGQVVPLTAEGSDRVRLAGTAVQTLKLAGMFNIGAAQITWRDSGGQPIALWTFTIELD